MKKIIVILLLTLANVTFAQPVSGDIEMIEIDSLSATPSPIQTQQSFEVNITTGFKTNVASKIALYFGENIELSLLGKTNLYSKSQAEQVLQHFFVDHKTKEFTVLHKGTSQASQYMICELITTEGTKYRVTITTKTEGAKLTMTSLRID
jgi:hypothetical protein